MASTISERVELAKLCSSRDWSKAIRVLDSLLSQSWSIQDICNRAFCYSQLELHKHVIKDCDRALQLDPTLLQAYIFKGRAFSALGRKEDALLVWEQGYEYAVQQSADLKQLLELEELLTDAKQNRSTSCENHALESSNSSLPESESGPLISSKSSEICNNQSKLSGGSEQQSPDSSLPASESGPLISSKSSEICNNQSKLSGDSEQQSPDSSLPASESGPLISSKSSEICNNHSKLSGESEQHGESSNTSVIHIESNCRSDQPSDSSDKVKKNIKSNSQPDGTYSSQSNGTYGSQPNGTDDLSGTSESSSILSVICSKSSDISEFRSKPSDKFGIRNELNDDAKKNKKLNDDAKKNKKFGITRIPKAKSITVDMRLSRGIAQVNEGKYAHAISIFDQILREDPTYPEALIGRGTAYAFQRELDSAIADFTKAIESNPSAGEAWKRRGQARAALGESMEAVSDLTKALEFEPNSADILHERGIVKFKFKEFNAVVEDLSACVKLDKNNKSAYTYLGLALCSLGEYRKAEEAHMKSIQIDQNFLEAWAHLTQFYQDLANSEKALECLKQALQIDGRFAKAYHLRGLLLHGMGEHRNAIKELSNGLRLESANIESLYLRASCHHAIGEYREAVKDYDAALDLELDSMEKFVFQCLAFYQKEIALYTASKIISEFCWFDIDGDIDPLFKEYWCKRLHPKNVCEKVYRQPPLRDSLKKGKLRKHDFAITKQKSALLQAADYIGKKIQYNCPGFLPNRRQHRMAGLAAIQIAQKVSKAWRSLQIEWKYSNKGTSKYGKRTRRKEKISIPSQNRGGAGCSTSNSSETSTSYGVTEDKSSGRSMMSWHDVYSFAVKWRQISEPCDPVVWINKLSEEFNSGFGSHTPLILGQAKVVRYFPNFQRTLNVAKAVMKEKKYVYNKGDNIIDLSEDGKLQDIMNAESCSDLYRVVNEDFWLATWCNSTAFEGRRLEGTRITLLKMGEHGFDFAIRTPCTPSRWEAFDAEMAMAWEALCNAYCGDTYMSTDFDVLENVRDAILRMTYYWYNFMPLSRGSAAVGFVVLLGLLLAANMEFTGSIPQGLQVDWEAILNFDPNSFVDSVKSWLYPSLKVTTSWKDYPDVTSTFETTGSVVAALSSYSD